MRGDTCQYAHGELVDNEFVRIMVSMVPVGLALVGNRTSLWNVADLGDEAGLPKQLSHPAMQGSSQNNACDTLLFPDQNV